MKNIDKTLSILAAAAMLAGCSSYDEANDPLPAGNGTYVQLLAEVTAQPESRAGIIVDGTTFTGVWENEDAMGVFPSIPGTEAYSPLQRFVYNSSEFAFEGSLPSSESGDWSYLAFYPHTAVNGKTVSVPFGNLRTQQGNAFNCAYDALAGELASFQNAAPGKTDEGETVRFNLHRLTSILNLESKSGGVSDKVRYVLLTSENKAQPISAASLDFDLLQAGANAALNTTDATNVIALGFDPGSAPAANALDAFFNIMPGNYDKLTFDVITEAKQIGTASFTRNDPDRKLVAGKLYQLSTGLQFSDIAQPTFVWPGEDGKAIDEVHEITTDESGTSLDYSAAVTIDVPGGIAGLEVRITSAALNGNGLDLELLDLFNDELELPGMSSGKAIQYQKSTVFDITQLVPLIMILPGADPGSDHIFEVTVTDLAGNAAVTTLTFRVPGGTPSTPAATYNNDANLWKNTASLTITNVTAGTQPVLEYRIDGTQAWKEATVTAGSDDSHTATIAPDWAEDVNPSGLTIHTVDPTTGIFAKNTYEYRLKVNDEVVDSGKFTPADNGGDSIENGDMEGWGTKAAPDNASKTIPDPNAAGNTFWASGNNMYMAALTGGKAAKLCLQNTDKAGRGGTSCAELSAQNVFSVFAAGNLFTGVFTMDGSVGYAQFGQKYDYSARPTGLKLKYAATINKIDKVANGAPATKNDIDKARIFVCIIDWSARHSVKSGTSIDVNTFWDPETASSQAEGEIIGYGSYYVTESTGDSMEELHIPIQYYQRTDAPPTGNYTMIISCATSYLGDYLTGSYTNKLWVDDFEWVY